MQIFIGIWSPSPNSTPEPVRRQFNQDKSSIANNNHHQQHQPQKLSVSFKAPTPPPPPSFWTPKSAESPTFERKEFRPVRFESPKPQRKTYTSQRQVSVAYVCEVTILFIYLYTVGIYYFFTLYNF